jgi:hypothetical protein
MRVAKGAGAAAWRRNQEVHDMKNALSALALGPAFVVGAASQPALVAPASAQQAGVFVAGHWESDAGNVNGRGGGHFALDLSQNGSRIRWQAANRGEYLCSLEGTHCTGTWHGTSGSGWFDVWFSPDGGTFNGTWGYGSDRSASGGWSGRRTS